MIQTQLTKAVFTPTVDNTYTKIYVRGKGRITQKGGQYARVQNLPVLEMAKLWCPPQAMNPIGTPIKAFTTFGSLITLTSAEAGPKPSWPQSLLPQEYNVPSKSKIKVYWENLKA